MNDPNQYALLYSLIFNNPGIEVVVPPSFSRPFTVIRTADGSVYRIKIEKADFQLRLPQDIKEEIKTLHAHCKIIEKISRELAEDKEDINGHTQ